MLADHGVAHFGQSHQRMPGNHNLNLSQDYLTCGLLFGCGELVIQMPSYFPHINQVQICDHRVVFT